MKSPLIYVELKSGYSDNGPAWIGRPQYSKTGKLCYFNGKALRKMQRRQNFTTHVDCLTGEAYWVSGIKKDQSDRHWAGSGKVMVDRLVVEEYLAYVQAKTLSKSKYTVCTFDATDLRPISELNENRKADRQQRAGG